MQALTADQQAKVAQLKELLGNEVNQQLLDGGDEGLTPELLKRWLVARKWNLKDAQRDLAAHAAWRKAYVPKGRILEEEIGEVELAQRKSFLTGYDKQGHPLCICVVSKHKMLDSEKSKRHIAFTLDVESMMGAKVPNWDGKLVGIFDLRGVTSSNCDFTTLRNVFDLLQNHYPERLQKLWLFESPAIFYALFKMVSPFIDPVTREKIQFVYIKDGAYEELLKAIDPQYLPPEFNGTGSWTTAAEMMKKLQEEGMGSCPADALVWAAKQQQQQQAGSGGGASSAEPAAAVGRASDDLAAAVDAAPASNAPEKAIAAATADVEPVKA